MAIVRWRAKALDDLDDLDAWRAALSRLPVGPGLLVLVEDYFAGVDLNRRLPGAPVQLDGEPAGLRLLLLRIKRSSPYKVFFRSLDGVVEVRRVVHPRRNG